jgi:hypothetical protein
MAVIDDDANFDHLYYRETMHLSGLSADELTARLKEHVEGPLVFASKAEIARECVRRARQAEAAEAAAYEMLDELRSFIGKEGLLDVVLEEGGALRTVTPRRGYRPM